jgi:tetratricopeptide (TPR) repeat protein
VAGKGKALLQYLHKGPMSKGYSLLQTDLSVILTDGAFNCVSSSVLYNVIARRVGLDVCAFEIPSGSTGSGHVFSVLKDGDRMIPVETTNARGFDIHDNFKKKNKRQLSDLSLVAVIYYNHGVTLAQSKRYHEALLADLCALSLDKGNPQAANNAMAELITWERDLSDAGKYADALEVLRVGLTLAPRDARLVQNRKAVVHDIVMKEVKAGKFAEAWKKVDEHKEALGDKSLAHQMVLMIVDTQAQGHAQKKEWDAAVKIYAAALKKLPGDGHLTNNLVATYDDWARSYMDASNWADAIRVYEQGLTTLPGNGHLTNNLRYAQEQAKR